MRKLHSRTLLFRFSNHRQILIGMVGLLIGILVYLSDRPLDQVYFLYTSGLNISFHQFFPNVFGALGNTLPDFLHVFSFILITAGIVSCGKRGGLIICAGWFLTDTLFELGQKFSLQIVNIIPDTFAGIPFLENTKNYFLYGTYDPLDLAAVLLGTLMAYYVLIKTINRGPNYVKAKTA